MHLIGENTHRCILKANVTKYPEKEMLQNSNDGLILIFLRVRAIFRAPLEVSRDLHLKMLPFLLCYWRLFLKKKEGIFVQSVPVLLSQIQ